MQFLGEITQRPDRPERLCVLHPTAGVQTTFGVGEDAAASLRAAGFVVDGVEVFRP
jgi:hypothetical protein